MPNGAQALMKTLVDAGVEVCFTNPGTSEMHFVAALDSESNMRAVLTLFEGVATGAADGYARMADKPAATLLHLGCGLGNGLANLHNARKGNVPVVNIVGDHATYHVKYDAQLQSDIETVARNVSPGFVRTSKSTAELCCDVADAIAAARGLPGQVATLILPADVSWGDGGVPCAVPPMAVPPAADDDVIEAVAAAIRSGKKTALLLGGRALREPSLLAAARIAAQCDITLLAETFPTRIERGAGLPPVERIAYLAELAGIQLADVEHLILVDSKAPVSFFAYPGKRSYLVPDSCEVLTLATAEQDTTASLERLAQVLGADNATPLLQASQRPGRPRGKLTTEKVCKAVGHLLPQNAIIIDESITSGLMLSVMTAGAPRHDLITLTGGAIGQGLPNAVGAAIACPDRPVLALIGDGTAMYTLQALWTMARERLNVTSIIFNNASYSVLNIELERVGAEGAGEKAKSQLDLNGPVLNFAHLAQGMGVHGIRVSTTEDLVKGLEYALSQPGPHLIEVMVPESLSGLKRKALPWVLRSLPGLPLSLARALKRKIAP
ncbi:MAG: acetolactate synthase large subunit [Thalassolituus sp.]|jgi:acetolactate synthase I/II/III large subunit|nr:acetolactate synthase large subunit [Pseudomonadales bacterium]TNC85362.1 MAG: acetolactate synthase large subunit [Thalassolituus sp.]HAG95452.1 acetolactate synthase large subunit [Gammaproteobacteria bacterium]|tara:strand:- start:17005 stop:18663 length:1659 start_codon:yes stop_codon:yes gene_type:complete